MGGTRFAHFGETVRVSRHEHDAIVTETVRILSGCGISAHVIPHLGAKADFGDVDLLCARSDTHSALPDDSREVVIELARRDEAVASALGAVAHHRGAITNPTLHLLLQGNHGLVQMDVTSIEDDLLDFATSQLSWGDAGSIASVVARQMGLKLGMHGLAITTDEPGTLLRTRIHVTHAEALALTGYDAARHAAGFDTNEEVYEWVASGKYFDPRIWQFDRMTNKARQRALKRPAYIGFLAWMEARGLKPRYDWGDRRGARSDEWRERLLRMFPKVAEEIARQRSADVRPQGLRAFFNGDSIAAATGIRDPELRHLMNDIRKEVGVDALERMAAAGDHDGLAIIARRMASERAG